MSGTVNHRPSRRIVAILVSFFLALLAATVTATPATARTNAAVRGAGPCDIYAAGGTPCVAAHSTTRALYQDYDGPLYQVRRLSDGRTTKIGVVAPSSTPVPDPGGYANARAQDRFCADTTCFITTIYDQSPEHNDLTQAPRGNFHGPAMGGANNLPLAGMDPVSVNGHKVYGTYIEPGMGLRNNDTNGVAVDDEAEGMYWVIDGKHYNDGCCFDYGNTEIDSHDDGNGTMETSYYGNSTGWYYGQGAGPWVMTDQENNLVGCVNPDSNSKYCPNLPAVDNRFQTAVAKGEPHRWSSAGGDAQDGSLTTYYDGQRVDSSYDPMRKQGGIVLGNGGDNSVGSAGSFYEGVMTRGYPTDATDNAVQANIVAADYDVASLAVAPADQTDTPPGVQSFAPGESQDVTETYTNTTGATTFGVALGLQLPSGWSASVAAGSQRTFGSVAPDATVRTTFTVTAGTTSFEGDLVGKATWTDSANSSRQSVTARQHVRDTSPVTINEFRVATSDDPTNSFIELANSAGHAVNVSGWTLTQHATEQAVDSTITVPPNTTIPAHGHYVLGLADSGLSAPAAAGDRTVYLRSTTGLSAGDRVRIGDGADGEVRRIASVNATGATGPRVAGRIGKAVRLSGNGEYVSLPHGIVSSLSDFTVSAWVNPSADSTWSRIFDFGTGTSTNMFLTVDGGGAGLRFAITAGGNANGSEQQLTGGGQLPLNTWSQVTVTHSGDTGRLYLNGAEVATNTNMTLDPSDLGDTNQNWIGKSQYNDPYLNATVDDFQIYDHALSADEVGTLAGGQPGAGNVASYAFDEKGGPTVVDSSGQGNDATIISDAASSGAGTPLFQPLPDGPITVPAGSTNVPVTSTSGFEVGQHVSVGYGDTIETAVVTDVGQPGTQGLLTAQALAGTSTLQVNTSSTITVGDTIRLDIGSRKETVHVAAVGDNGSLTLTAPLQYTHSSNLPFADRGTGITFSPATTFAHSSLEPVKPLGSGVTLTRSLGRSHGTNAAVVDRSATGAGYQGTPDQWFGGPALSGSAGSMVLHDAHGSTADSLNYGLLVDPWLQEGYQGASGSGAYGCFVPTPGTDRSAIRYPDGTDSDTNCVDFITTQDTTPGADNRSVALEAGPRVSIRTTGDGSSLRHDDFDDLAVLSAVTATSSEQVKQDATFVETAGLADASCVSFESVNRPGSYLRHFNYIVHLQSNDGGPTFAQDATFCPKDGNSGQGVSYQSKNFPDRYLRAYQGRVYIASDGGDHAFDASADFDQDTSWQRGEPWAAAG